MQLAMLQFETKLQKCIRMGITIFKNFISAGISLDIVYKSCFTALLACRHKPNFRLYIRRHTSANENFECNYPINICRRYKAAKILRCIFAGALRVKGIHVYIFDTLLPLLLFVI